MLSLRAVGFCRGGDYSPVHAGHSPVGQISRAIQRRLGQGIVPASVQQATSDLERLLPVAARTFPPPQVGIFELRTYRRLPGNY
jgi:hypothetical protein